MMIQKAISFRLLYGIDQMVFVMILKMKLKIWNANMMLLVSLVENDRNDKIKIVIFIYKNFINFIFRLIFLIIYFLMKIHFKIHLM